MSDLRNLKLVQLAKALDWRIEVRAGNDTIAYSADGTVARGAFSLSEYGASRIADDDDVLSAVDTVELSLDTGDAVTMDADSFLRIAPHFEHWREQLRKWAQLTVPPAILPTETGELGKQMQDTHDGHGMSVTRLVPGDPVVRAVRCAECLANQRDFFRVGLPAVFQCEHDIVPFVHPLNGDEMQLPCAECSGLPNFTVGASSFALGRNSVGQSFWILKR